MKYYKITVRRFYENDMIATNAKGNKIENGSDFFWRMDKGELITDAPLFDYFFLESFDKKKYWEWMLADVHNFIGEGSQIPGWLVSTDLKLLLENMKLTDPYHFYPSKLMFRERKLDYYIFQFTGKSAVKKTLLYIDYTKTFFWDPNKEIKIRVKNHIDFLSEYQRIYKEGKGIDDIIQNKKLVLNEAFDFFPMGTFLKDDLVSERLKQAIETVGITGFEFSELDYEVVVDNG